MKVRNFLASLIIMLMAVSCEYETIEFEAELPKDVSYQNDILPLFDQSCNSASCHKAGGIPPDLSRESGYADLSSDSEMVNVNSPASSILYVRMIDTDKPMPLNGILPPTQTNLVLVWIQEGAKDN